MELKQLTERYSIDPEEASRALQNISDGSALILVMSGKLGSGKDTVAPAVMRTLGYENAAHISFADLLREESDLIIDAIRNSNTRNQAIDAISQKMGSPKNISDLIVEAVFEEVKSDLNVNSKTRTKGVRRLLQIWGTDFRRTHDPDYWVKASMRTAISFLARGVSVYATDARFDNEVDSVLELGGYAVRLKVSPENQIARIMSRDGIVPTQEALTHISETALDEYETENKFSFVVDTNLLSAEEVVAHTSQLIRKHRVSLKSWA